MSLVEGSIPGRGEGTPTGDVRSSPGDRQQWGDTTGLTDHDSDWTNVDSIDTETRVKQLLYVQDVAFRRL